MELKYWMATLALLWQSEYLTDSSLLPVFVKMVLKPFRFEGANNADCILAGVGWGGTGHGVTGDDAVKSFQLRNILKSKT